MTSSREVGLYNPTLRAIAAAERRSVLRGALSRGSLTERDISAYIALIELDTTTLDPPEMEALRTDLVHSHLPKLEEAALIEWDRSDGVVTISSHPAFNDPRFKWLLRIAPDGLDEALLGLSHEYRRIPLTVLRAERNTMPRTALAEAIRDRVTETTSASESLEEIVLSLYHVHLPQLAEAALIEYDAQTGRASYSGHVAIEEIFSIIYEPDEHLVEKYDGLLSGLSDVFPAGGDRGIPAEWPHFWGVPYHG